MSSRRRFLKEMTLAGAALALPSWMTLPAPHRVRTAPARPVRVRGRVQEEGRGLGRVAVTDGLEVVETASDGTFVLIADARRPFVYLSLPAGYAVPQNETGTARFYRPLQPDARGEMQAEFELERLAEPDEHHAFLALADPQTQNAYEMRLFHDRTVPDLQEAVRELTGRPVFGVSVGDIMFDDLSLYPEYERAVERVGVPFFQVIGNHDLDFEGVTDPASAATFRSHFGPTYYSFDRGAVHYVVLDDVFWNHDRYFGYLDADQLAWLEQDLARVEAGRPVVVFQHIPALSTRFRRAGRDEPYAANTVSNREHLYRLLEPYQAHIVSGHTHETEHVFEGGVHEHVRGTVCGAWWSGPICFDGTPNGYSVYEADGEALRWHHRPTGGAADEQLRVYPRGADPMAPDEMVANVWDWDPEWTVVWYEDGVRRGPMARRVGLDPLAVALHEGAEAPPRRTWVEPVPTGHLFYAPVAEDAGRLRVEVVDRWGDAFSASPQEGWQVELAAPWTEER